MKAPNHLAAGDADSRARRLAAQLDVLARTAREYLTASRLATMEGRMIHEDAKTLQWGAELESLLRIYAAQPK